jgi:membrane AbrB-like protein
VSKHVAWIRHPDLAGMVAALLAGVIGAVLCVELHTPLPWMLGAVFGSSVAAMARHQTRVTLVWPSPARNFGQWVIGCALGLYFTPYVVGLVLRLAPWIVLGIVFSLLLGALMAWALYRMTGVDRTTAFFAMAIGGASEMVNQAERFGARTDRVAASHSLRLLTVVSTIPFAYQWLNLHGVDPYEAAAQGVHPGGLMALAVLTTLGAAIALRLRTPNAWVIGPLVAGILLTSNGLVLSALPREIINAGQLCIGVSLGVRFTPEFFRAAPRYLAAVVLIVAMGMLVSIGFAALVAAGTGLPLATIVLATSPGGIAEMSLTARILQLGVPVVTAFHVTRMSTMVICIGPLWKLVEPRLR